MAGDRFDPVFASYVEALPRIRRRADADVRAPQVFSAVWDRLRVRPPSSRVILVTGSKGKGTTARLIAWNLQRAGRKVGLVTSPEEIDHFDRIRLDDAPIPAEVFDRFLAESLPLLQDELRNSAPDRYLSPTGIFLTVALQWFAEASPDWIVIEGGRGVRHDEIGRLRAQVAVVTSVLPEHVQALGGSLDAVARDKLSVAAQAERAVGGPGVRRWPVPQNMDIVDAGESDAQMPRWYGELLAISRAAIEAAEPGIPCVPLPTPSYLRVARGGKPLVCEALVSGASVDHAALRAALPPGSAAVLGLTDDKDWQGLVARLRELGFATIAAFELGSAAGHVSARWVADNPGVMNLGPFDVVQPDGERLRAALDEMLRTHPGVYACGVQLFLRSIRQALGLARASA